MARGPALIAEEQGFAKEQHEEDVSSREIARRPKRCHKVMGNFLNNTELYKKEKKRDVLSKLSSQDVCQIRRAPSFVNLSVRDIMNDLHIAVSVRRVQQLLSTDPFVTYRKVKRTLPLKLPHKTARIIWATAHARWPAEKWAKAFFIDEKNFNLMAKMVLSTIEMI